MRILIQVPRNNSNVTFHWWKLNEEASNWITTITITRTAVVIASFFKERVPLCHGQAAAKDVCAKNCSKAPKPPPPPPPKLVFLCDKDALKCSKVKATNSSGGTASTPTSTPGTPAEF